MYKIREIGSHIDFYTGSLNT